MIAIVVILLLIVLSGCYMFAWSRRMMPSQAEICDAKKKDGGEIVKLNNFSLWTKVFGKDARGTPVVFIPGGMGLKSSYLEEAFSKLSKTNPVIFYDPRGCGRSESKADLSFYTWDKFAEELYSLIKYYAPNKKVILAAHSCGCCILYSFLQKHKTMVDKVILLSCMSLTYEAKMPNIIELIRQFPPKEPKAANKWFESYAKSKILFGNMFAEKENLTTFDTEDMSMVMCTNINVKMNKPYNYTGEFNEWEVPVLILRGNDRWESEATNSNCTRRLEKEFKNTVSYAFENSGHFFFAEEREVSLNKIREFI